MDVRNNLGLGVELIKDTVSFLADMFDRYGAIVKEETLWNFPIISLMSREDIQKVLRYTSKYPLRPPTEVTAYYRQSRPDRYTNLGLVNE